MAFGNGPRVVTDGLVLALDASDRNSYISGSSTWFDLTTNQYTASLINGPAFNSQNGGSIFFDGTNDYADLNSNNIIAGTNPFTIESFYKTTGGTNGAIFTNYGAGYPSGVWFAGRYGLYINSDVYAVGAPLPLGTYYMAELR